MSFQEFIDMGGFGFYIWTSYFIAAVIFSGLFVSMKMQRTRLIKQIRRRISQQQKGEQSSL